MIYHYIIIQLESRIEWGYNGEVDQQQLRKHILNLGIYPSKTGTYANYQAMAQGLGWFGAPWLRKPLNVILYGHMSLWSIHWIYCMFTTITPVNDTLYQLSPQYIAWCAPLAVASPMISESLISLWLHQQKGGRDGDSAQARRPAGLMDWLDWSSEIRTRKNGVKTTFKPWILRKNMNKHQDLL